MFGCRNVPRNYRLLPGENNGVFTVNNLRRQTSLETVLTSVSNVDSLMATIPYQRQLFQRNKWAAARLTGCNELLIVGSSNAFAHEQRCNGTEVNDWRYKPYSLLTQSRSSYHLSPFAEQLSRGITIQVSEWWSATWSKRRHHWNLLASNWLLIYCSIRIFTTHGDIKYNRSVISRTYNSWTTTHSY